MKLDPFHCASKKVSQKRRSSDTEQCARARKDLCRAKLAGPHKEEEEQEDLLTVNEE